MFIKLSLSLLFILASTSAQSLGSSRFEQQQQPDRGYDGSNYDGSQQQVPDSNRGQQNTVEGEGVPEPPALVPQTSFTCSDKPYNPGMYADMEVDCSVYHMCFGGRKESFLCGTGTMFNQEILSCDHPQNVNCQGSPNFYSANEELGKPGAEPTKGDSPRPQSPRPVAPPVQRPVQRPVISGAPRPRPAPVSRPIPAQRPVSGPNYNQGPSDQSPDYDGPQQPDFPPEPISNQFPAPAPAPRPAGKTQGPAPRPIYRPSQPVQRPVVPAPRPLPKPAPAYRQPAPAPIPAYRPAPPPAYRPAPSPAYKPAPAPISPYNPSVTIPQVPAPVRRPSKTSPKRPIARPIPPPVVQTTDEDTDYEPSSVYYQQELPKQQTRSRYASRQWSQYRS